MNPPTENITGYAVSTRNISACVADVVTWVQQAPPDRPGRWLACLNPHSYAVALDDPPFAQALHAADWLGAAYERRVNAWDGLAMFRVLRVGELRKG